jgi:TPR repeat protein
LEAILAAALAEKANLLTALKSGSAESQSRLLDLEQQLRAAQAVAEAATAKSGDLQEKLSKLEEEVEALTSVISFNADELAASKASAVQGAADAAEARVWAEREVATAYAALKSEADRALEASAQVVTLQKDLVAAQEIAIASTPTGAATKARDALEAQLATSEAEVKGLKTVLSYMNATNKEALRWFHKAAEGSNPEAQLNLGIVYMNGHGVAQSDKEAVQWWLKSAEQGNAMAQNNLGYFYWSGRGVPKSYKEALKWYRKAAFEGNANAQSNLGLAYENGQGVVQNYEEAMRWFMMAAEQGHPTAQLNIGGMHKQGKGVPQNNEEAARWWRKAADQGLEAARARLAQLKYF